ncbi:MAG: MerC domain-containing protein [Bacteroidetes bacterium]|nr:hypothetical protein AWN76_000650 [Rhodothermaceae bacterium RA]RMH63180.1 MAG: MerC domain-containing protein [Bacteroidota bacterium]
MASSGISIKWSGWDRIGIALSGLCIVHCLLLPVALAVAPLWSALAAVHDGFHLVLAVLLVPTTVLAVRSGYRQHRDRGVLGLLSSGLAIIVAAALLGHDVLGDGWGTGLTLIGSVLLIAGHWRNWQRRRACRVKVASTVA